MRKRKRREREEKEKELKGERLQERCRRGEKDEEPERGLKRMYFVLSLKGLQGIRRQEKEKEKEKEKEPRKRTFKC